MDAFACLSVFAVVALAVEVAIIVRDDLLKWKRGER